MFEQGEYVFYENKGICKIEEITHMDISGADKKRLYYILIPDGVRGGRIYCPVDNEKVRIRRIMTAEEAKKLLAGIPEADELWNINDKQREEAYKEALRSCNPAQWIRIVKTMFRKRRERAAEGKKITSTDGKYLAIVEDFLYGELAVALGIDRAEAKELVSQKLKEKAVAV